MLLSYSMLPQTLSCFLLISDKAFTFTSKCCTSDMIEVEGGLLKMKAVENIKIIYINMISNCFFSFSAGHVCLTGKEQDTGIGFL